MANCLKCGAECAVHSLHCEHDIMNGEESIDCKTFRVGEPPHSNVMVALAVLKEATKRGWLPEGEFPR